MTGIGSLGAYLGIGRLQRAIVKSLEGDNAAGAPGLAARADACDAMLGNMVADLGVNG